jgi:hypothetical protein
MLTRVWLLHRWLFLDEAGWAPKAVSLASELLAQDQATESATEMALLPAAAPIRDVEPLARQMLAEYGLPVPLERPNDRQVRSYLAWAFAHDLIDTESLMHVWIDHDQGWCQGRTFERDIEEALRHVDLGDGERDWSSLVASLRERLARR